MEKDYRFKVNLGGIIDILSNHLYSSTDVFIRELLQNGVDAINARKKVDSTWMGERIGISIVENKESKTIVFEDNGIGLTEEEIHRFLAIIGESSKKQLIDGSINNDYIGRFGIGLLSCFMVSDEINLVTRSINSDYAYHWVGKPDGTYSIKKIDSKVSYGTTVYLRSKKDNEEYYDYENLTKLIRYYGNALPIPIFLNKDRVEYRVNEGLSFFNYKRKSKSEILNLGEEIFNEKFIDFIPIKTSTAEVVGIAYILSHKVAANVKNSHRVYLKNMLLTEKGDNILPDWSFFVKCILNTNSLRPTASRENFYEDDMLRKTREEVGKCIINYLADIAENDTKKLAKIVRVHDLAIKSLAVDDDTLYKIFFDYLSFETSQGIKTGYELRTQYKSLKYTDSVDTFKQISAIFNSQDMMLINGGYVYLAELLSNMKSNFTNIKVELVDNSSAVQIMKDLTYREEELCYKLIRTANIVLDRFDCRVDIKHFKPSELPMLYIINDNAMMFRDLLDSKEKSSELFGGILDGFIDEFKEDTYSTLCFNYDNELIHKLMNISDTAALKSSIELLYVQSLLMGSFPLRHNEMKVLNNGIISLIEWGISK